MSASSSINRDHIIVIDPGVHTPEIDCFNFLSLSSSIPMTYHLPALYGLESLSGAETWAARDGRVKGIVILGSECSVNERYPWQTSLERWLMPLLLAKIPTLGICYGHQMLAHMFGGEVDFLFPDQRKLSGFRAISMAATGWWSSLPAIGQVAVTHNESVKKAPPNMTVIGSSPEVPVDGLAHASLPIWSVQSHPEATEAFLLHSSIAQPQHEGALDFGHKLVASFLHFAASKK